MEDHDQLLDYFGEFESETKIVVAKYFYTESEARIYAAQLKTVNIPSFISGATTLSTIPLGQGGIGLHVREKDLVETLRIIKVLDKQNERDLLQEESFHDADMDEIAYQKSLHIEQNNWTYVWILIVMLILLVLFRVLTKGGIINWAF